MKYGFNIKGNEGIAYKMLVDMAERNIIELEVNVCEVYTYEDEYGDEYEDIEFDVDCYTNGIGNEYINMLLSQYDLSEGTTFIQKPENDVEKRRAELLAERRRIDAELEALRCL